ncbi:putative beta-lysine N-acetyltransferase [Alkalibaculum sp. M08DMB]|uniref:Putative beta-lysine N-acetyltransferase n=1 Tax=Alkalibaculum sporogenes TaxID=2655001 RepID=A0A6A7K9I0_9FIRM|nr:putative beta-lysine N-acetyltransferase [Alkalibaculum sporogenes]MPW26015.1 putative beta-lysine N-acetyltransferase [Alkalibaculum sporogenes]
MNGSITNIGNSVIQHDKDNNRIYIIKFDNSLDTLEYLDKLAIKNNYTKIVAKTPSSSKSLFIEKKYAMEAKIPHLYRGVEDGYFFAKYFHKDREVIDEIHITNVLDTASKRKDVSPIPNALPKGFHYRIANLNDSKEISNLYRIIFKTYPFPIHDEQYIVDTMKYNVIYFTIWKDTQLVSVSSSEMDEQMHNVEMTDFGTLPKYRGMGFSSYLLEKMESTMKKRGIITAYTIARSLSYAMNITFSKHGYNFSGTLKNNTNISGGIESMNVWYKLLI